MCESRGKIVVVSGTDTGVGKTVVAALLTRALISRGLNARPLKPFSSGGREDAEILRAAVAGRWSLDEINPFAFRAPLTPLLAGEEEGRAVSFEECVAVVNDAAADSDVLVVEGAGGLMSPLGVGYDALGLIQELGARSILVAPDRLGVINHVLLSLVALQGAGCDAPLVVLNRAADADDSRAGNLSLLERLRPGIGFEALEECDAVNGENGGENFLQKTLAALMGRT